MSVEGIVLAAGLSSRFGSHKMVFRIDGLTILERCISSMREACDRVIVVGGYQFENLVDILAPYSWVVLIANPNFQEGMLSSIRVGISASRASSLFITPGDYPFISPSTYPSLLKGANDLAVPTYKGRRGHPVLIRRRLADMLVNSAEYTSLRDFIHRQGAGIVDVDDPGILWDVDTPEDASVFADNHHTLLNKKG